MTKQFSSEGLELSLKVGKFLEKVSRKHEICFILKCQSFNQTFWQFQEQNTMHTKVFSIINSSNTVNQKILFE